MNILLRFSLLFLVNLAFSGCNIFITAEDVELNTDPEIRGSLGHPCDSDFRKGMCLDGYTCVNVTERPHIVAVCYPSYIAQQENFTIEDYRLDKIIDEEQGFVYLE